MNGQPNIFADPRIRRVLARAYPLFQDRLDDLPRQVGGCAWGAAAIASILGDMGLPAEVVIGTFRRGRWTSDHCWARSGGWILDWATGQFKVGHPWLITPDCDRRYVMGRGRGMSQPAIIIGGWPGAHARDTLAQAMADWPSDQRGSGPDFDRFLEAVRQAASLNGLTGPSHDLTTNSEEETSCGPVLQRPGLRYLPHFAAPAGNYSQPKAHLEDPETPCRACLRNDKDAIAR